MNTLYHIQIARSAFRDYLSPAALDRVIRFNFNTDFYGSPGWKIMDKKVFPLYFAGRHWYKQSDHFDQYATADEIIANWRLHRDRIFEVIDDSKYPPRKLKAMFRILGRSPHSISDIPSHSNFVTMLFDYYRADPAARDMVVTSGLDLASFIAEHGPTFSQAVLSDRFMDFREKCFPKMFSFDAVPDSGPRCHTALGMDSPTSPPCLNGDYPGLFKAVFRLGERDTVDIVRKFFDRLKAENPEKFSILTESYRNVKMPADRPGPAERRAKFWATKVGGWD